MELSSQLREVAEDSLSVVPQYQCLLGTPEALSDKILLLTYKDDKLAAFGSAFVFEAPDIGLVLHLGLLCIRQDARGQGLMAQIYFRLIWAYLLREKKLRKGWVTNLSSVPSVLAHVSEFGINIFPSPKNSEPNRHQKNIASYMAARHRDALHLRHDSPFDHEKFVFRFGNKDNVFHKREFGRGDLYRHNEINQYFNQIADFPEGDVVLQVGQFGLMTFVRGGAETLL